MAAREHPLAERLNDEPVIFRGCSSSELLMLLGMAAAVWIPGGGFLGAALGGASMGLGLSAAGILGTVFVAATVLQRVKRGRPTGYYQQRIMLAMHRAGLRRLPVVMTSGSWDIGRHR